MDKEKLSPTNILKRIESIETELAEIRKYLAESLNDAAKSEVNAPSFNLSYTLDDLYNAMGKKSHYTERLRNALEKQGIKTLPQFLTLSTGEVLDLEWVGTATLHKTKNALAKLGIKW